jgi:hypothetical protein
MRPRSYLSAALIYGTMLGLIAVLVFWLLGAGATLPEYLFIFVFFGLSLGLTIGYLQGPATRTFDPAVTVRLDQALRALHYHLQAEAPGHATYRIDSALPWSGIVDVVVETGTSPLRVSGPRDTLRRLANKLGR